MGRRRPFIDKKTATTYSLVFRSAEDAAADADAPSADAAAAPPARALVDARAGVRVGCVDAAAVAAAGGPPERGPRAWLAAEAGPPGGLAPDRRRELLELGFPDDGYDYGRHLRAAGGLINAETSLETNDPVAAAAAAAGPSVFVPAPASLPPPAVDVRLDDATRLTLHDRAADDDAAAAAAGGVTAFSRRVGAAPRRGAVAAAVAEINATLDAAVDDEGATSVAGSLEDDFVLAAAAAGDEEEEEEGEEEADSDGDDGWPSDASYASSGGDAPARLPGASVAPSRAGGRGAAGSIASTYWRPERTDRSGVAADVDAAFEALALQYDSDEIGELDDKVDDGTMLEGVPGAGGQDPAAYGRVFDAFLAAHATRDHAHEGGQRYVSAATLAGDGDDAAAAAVAVARAAAARAAAAAAREEAREGASGDDDDRAGPLPPSAAFSPPPRAWDCETVLSLAPSTASSARPSVLDGGGAGRRAGRSRASVRFADDQRGGAAGGLLDQLTLSRKTGLPLAAAAPAPAASAPRTPPQPARRPAGETADEKRARKAAVKDARRAARASRKETAALFKEASGAVAARAAVARVDGVHIA